MLGGNTVGHSTPGMSLAKGFAIVHCGCGPTAVSRLLAKRQIGRHAWTHPFNACMRDMRVHMILPFPRHAPAFCLLHIHCVAPAALLISIFCMQIVSFVRSPSARLLLHHSLFLSSLYMQRTCCCHDDNPIVFSPNLRFGFQGFPYAYARLPIYSLYIA